MIQVNRFNVKQWRLHYDASDATWAKRDFFKGSADRAARVFERRFTLFHSLKFDF